MGDDIETGSSTGSNYWAALRWLRENENRPQPMSSPINNPAYATLWITILGNK